MQNKITENIRIKNMVCNSCIKLIKLTFEKNEIQVDKIFLGQAQITYDENKISKNQIQLLLQDDGFELISDRETHIVEEIKHAVIDLVHHMNNIDSIVRKSEYLVEKLGMSYQQISKIFSKHENITLEKYTILQKIERIKALIDNDEYTLSEIAYMMDYSSVQHLSAQFKTITNLTVTEYKNRTIDETGMRKSINF